MPGITIIGTGRYAPGPPVDNHALARVMDTSDEWVRQRTGIVQRHFAPDGIGASDLAIAAANRALDSAGVDPSDVDYVVFATMTPDYLFPGSGGLLAAKLGIPGVPALDIRQQCAAIPFGIQVADGLVGAGAASTVLLVGAEAHAGFMPWEENWNAVYDEGAPRPTPEARERNTRHRNLAVIFGDGAGALVLRRHEREGHGFLGAVLHSDGRLYEHIYIEGGGFRHRPYVSREMLARDEHIPKMMGRDLFKQAVTELPKVVRDVCHRHGVTLEEIDWFIAHQANDRINGAVAKALGVPEEKVPSNIARYGNTSGGTIPILLDELNEQDRLEPGQLLCFLALGAGLHWGAALLRL
ncbi:MAG: 3-oxoacyl-ACP synthase III family protein [Polyangiales bacterium]